MVSHVAYVFAFGLKSNVLKPDTVAEAAQVAPDITLAT